MGKQKGKGGFGRYFKLGLMGIAAIGSGAMPSTIGLNAPRTTNAPLSVQQAPQDQKQAPITNPVPIRAERQTPIGTAMPRKKKGIMGSIPQKHAKRHTNRIHASRKAKRKHSRA